MNGREWVPAPNQKGKDGWLIDVDPEREIADKHPKYLTFVKKTGRYEWRDR